MGTVTHTAMHAADGCNAELMRIKAGIELHAGPNQCGGNNPESIPTEQPPRSFYDKLHGRQDDLMQIMSAHESRTKQLPNKPPAYQEPGSTGGTDGEATGIVCLQINAVTHGDRRSCEGDSNRLRHNSQ